MSKWVWPRYSSTSKSEFCIEVYNMKCEMSMMLTCLLVPISSPDIKVCASDRWKLHKNRRVLPQIFGHTDFLSFFFITTKIPASTNDRSLKILLFEDSWFLSGWLFKAFAKTTLTSHILDITLGAIIIIGTLFFGNYSAYSCINL